MVRADVFVSIEYEKLLPGFSSDNKELCPSDDFAGMLRLAEARPDWE